ncbi:MAG: hypothetical protein J6R35_02895, partial [Clostridia bacterium]|nr:hypothetical protein [Clostridia bacterium]
MKNIKKRILSVLIILVMIVGIVPLCSVTSSAASPTSLDFVIAGYKPGELATGMNCYLNADKKPDLGNYVDVEYVSLYTNLSDAKLGWDSYDNEILYNTDYWLSIYITPKSGFNVNTVSTATLVGVQGATYVGMFNDSIKSDSIDGWFVVFKLPKFTSNTEETVDLVLQGYEIGESVGLALGYEDAKVGERKVWNEGSRVDFYTSVDKARLGDDPISSSNKFITTAQYYVCFNVESDNQFNIASLRNATLNISGARYEGTFRDTKNADRWNIIFKLPMLSDDSEDRVSLHLEGYDLNGDPTLVSYSEVLNGAVAPKVEILTAEFYTSLEEALVGEQGNAGYKFYSNTNYWVAIDVLPSPGYRIGLAEFSLDIPGAWLESVHASPDGGSSWRIVFKLPTLSLEKTEVLYFDLGNYEVGKKATGVYATEVMSSAYGDYRVYLDDYAVYRN